jgi:hypothetical protein
MIRLLQDPYHARAALLQVLAPSVVPVQRHRNETRGVDQFGEPCLSGGALTGEEGCPGRGGGDEDDGGDSAEVEDLVEDGKADQGRHGGFQAH